MNADSGRQDRTTRSMDRITKQWRVDHVRFIIMIRPHRRTLCSDAMRPIATDVRRSVVCVCVRASVSAMGTRANPDIDRTDREPVMGMLSIEPVKCWLKDPCIWWGGPNPPHRQGQFAGRRMPDTLLWQGLAAGLFTYGCSVGNWLPSIKERAGGIASAK